jgi:hypothetical protein
VAVSARDIAILVAGLVEQGVVFGSSFSGARLGAMGALRQAENTLQTLRKLSRRILDLTTQRIPKRNR